MRKIIRLTESDLKRIVKKVISEAPTTTYEDTPEGLKQYVKDTENKNINIDEIKKEGNVYIVKQLLSYRDNINGFSRQITKYQYQNGRFIKLKDDGSLDKNAGSSNAQKAFESFRNYRGTQDGNILRLIQSFYSKISSSKNISKDWDEMRRLYRVELYIPSWQEYQFMQNLA